MMASTVSKTTVGSIISSQTATVTPAIECKKLQKKDSLCNSTPSKLTNGVNKMPSQRDNTSGCRRSKQLSSTNSLIKTNSEDSSTSGLSAPVTIKDFNQINHRLKENGIDSSTISQLISLVHSGKVNIEQLLEKCALRLLIDIYRNSSVNGVCVQRTMAAFFDFVETELERDFVKENVNCEPNPKSDSNFIEILEKWREKLKGHCLIANGHSDKNRVSNRKAQSSISLNYDTSNNRKIINFMTYGAIPHYPGPNEEKLFEILNRNSGIGRQFKFAKRF